MPFMCGSYKQERDWSIAFQGKAHRGSLRRASVGDAICLLCLQPSLGRRIVNFEEQGAGVWRGLSITRANSEEVKGDGEQREIKCS